RSIAGLGDSSKNGRAATLIDILHRALRHWSDGDRVELDEYLDSSGARTNEELWKVAGALSRILPLESTEKRLIDGLWGKYGGDTATDVAALRARSQTTLGRFAEGS